MRLATTSDRTESSGIIRDKRPSTDLLATNLILRDTRVAQWIESIGEVGQNLETINAYNSVYTKL